MLRYLYKPCTKYKGYELLILWHHIKVTKMFDMNAWVYKLHSATFTPIDWMKKHTCKVQ